jgi:S-DNA-T family DNA segregation ATPase FtsK/SpoIIIE
MKVSSGMDSRIVLDAKGGELLLGHGDMLFLSPRSSKLTRAQGTLVDDSEIRKTTKFLKGIATQAFEPQLVQIKSEGGEEGEDDGERDPLFNDAVEVVLETQRGSVSLLQRRLTIGYSRSSRIIEQMERYGILGGHKTAQARQVLISEEEWAAMKAQAAADAGVADGEGLDAEAAADDHLESLDAVAEGDGDVVEAGADDDELDDVALADDGEEWEEVESA